MPKSEIINDVLRFVQFGEGNSVTCIASHQVPPEIIVMISVMMVMMTMMMVVSARFFNDWVDQVKAEIPAERLLVFEVKQGWGPLCQFLGEL